MTALREPTDEQRMLRDMVRAFAREEVAPLARTIDREERFPTGYGSTDEFPVERFMRDAKLMQIGGGTSEIQQHIIARGLLGRSPGASA
jgi:alkylation response protein AidB-like acyl-CoA dehydrogenase